MSCPSVAVAVAHNCGLFAVVCLLGSSCCGLLAVVVLLWLGREVLDLCAYTGQRHSEPARLPSSVPCVLRCWARWAALDAAATLRNTAQHKMSSNMH